MQLQFTEKANTALKLAEKYAKQMKQGYIGTEHVLVGLIKEGTGIAAKVLEDNGVLADKVINLIQELIAFDNGVVVQDRTG